MILSRLPCICDLIFSILLPLHQEKIMNDFLKT